MKIADLQYKHLNVYVFLVFLDAYELNAILDILFWGYIFLKYFISGPVIYTLYKQT